MKQRMVYINGTFVPEPDAKISVFDAGFHLGDTVAEVIRTFEGRPFRVGDHLVRLSQSLRAARIDPGLSLAQIEGICADVLKRNLPLLKEHEDYWLTLSVTRGRVHSYTDETDSDTGPTLIIHCRPIPFGHFAAYYQQGVHAVTPPRRHIPPQCLDPKLKGRSRMHYVLADLEARLVDPQAWALLLDLDGNVTEGTASNFFVVAGGTLKTPTPRNVLCGVSRQVTFELAEELGMRWLECDLQVYDVVNADEAFFTSTSSCLLPASRINGVRIGGECPGPVTRKLLEAWSRLVGLDIVGQAAHFLW